MTMFLLGKCLTTRISRSINFVCMPAGMASLGWECLPVNTEIDSNDSKALDSLSLGLPCRARWPWYVVYASNGRDAIVFPSQAICSQ